MIPNEAVGSCAEVADGSVVAEGVGEGEAVGNLVGDGVGVNVSEAVGATVGKTAAAGGSVSIGDGGTAVFPARVSQPARKRTKISPPNRRFNIFMRISGKDGVLSGFGFSGISPDHGIHDFITLSDPGSGMNSQVVGLRR